MFTEKEMSKAIRWLFEQYVPADYEGYDEGEIGCAGGLYLPEVCISLRDLVQPVYQYSVQGGAEKGFDYRGPELFDQRACPLYVRVERTVMDAASTRYQTELWLLEDMTFAVVRCVAIAFGGAHGYITEYRTFKRVLESRDDIFFPPEELSEALQALCAKQWEHEATIYEL